MTVRAIAALSFLFLAHAAGLAHAACPPKSDWLVRSDPSLAPVRPADCSTVTQSPPEFLWPPQNGQHKYTVMLTGPGGKVETRTTPFNWLLWDRALPPGRYTWRVKLDGDEKMVTEPRTFTIAAGAKAFVVPPPAELVERAHKAPRPRTWAGEARKSLATIRTSAGSGWPRMVTEVENKMPSPVQPEPASTSVESNYGDAVAEQKRTLAAALAWVVTRERRFGDDAVRRLLAQARWNPAGATSHKNNDMGNRAVAWTLTLGYDWMREYLEEPHRKAILEAIRLRTEPMFDDVVPRIGKYPYDSHGHVTLAVVAAIGVLTAGDIPEADRWVREAVPLAIATTSPWGGNDGGFGNGSGQLFWDTGEHLPVWHVLRNALGVDMAQKDWVRNVARFMAYFTPVGAPAGAFGDGHELRPEETWARVAKALARFTGDPFARWYADSLHGEDPARLELLMAPVADFGKSSTPGNLPTAAFFPSVGWVAMHSDLDDPQRTSVYFKSSPYGSYNHSHGDQNAFLIDHRGERLAMSTGYYDGYQTPHWKQWYKHTRAANAITFDGGQGQGFNGKQFAGDVVSFRTDAGYDFAVGRAEKAYGGALTLARRAIVYLKPDKVLVVDRLESAQPRKWEWNLHAAKQMRVVDEKAVEVRGQRTGMCVEMLASPEVEFRQTDQFTAPPQGRRFANQWHGTFAAAQAAPHADFVALFRIGVGCAGRDPDAAKVVRGKDGLRIQVDGTTVVVKGDDVSVQAGA